MSSVIEVLKEDKDHIVTAITLLNSCKNDKIIVEKSLNQAIVALEQKESLKEWLEKKIEANQKRLDWQKNHGEIIFSAQICEGLEQRIADLKEVLDRVGEQK